MKYGVLTYLPTAEQRNWKHNLGDFIQSIALRNIYLRMGIKEEEIIEVNLFQLNEYDGEYCILPINCYNVPYREGKSYLPPSSKIIPVYISFNLIAHTIEKNTLQNLLAYQPIGCRDEATMHLLRKHGVRAYLTGCLTATLPMRNQEPKKGKVYIIDVQEELIPFIPENLMEKAVYHTQLITDTQKPDKHRVKELYQMSVDILNELQHNAELVITRRMHVASPCIAMGIPVVLARNCFDTRYAWIEKYIHPYSREEYSEIDWAPSPVHFEEEKAGLIEFYQKQISKVYELYHDIYKISEHFENRKRCQYHSQYMTLLEDIKSQRKQDEKIHFIIWGIFVHAPYLLQLIPEVFGYYEITIIDSFITGKFEEYPICKPEIIETLPEDAVCIVTAPSIVPVARELLRNSNKEIVLLEFCDDDQKGS